MSFTAQGNGRDSLSQSRSARALVRPFAYEQKLTRRLSIALDSFEGAAAASLRLLKREEKRREESEKVADDEGVWAEEASLTRCSVV